MRPARSQRRVDMPRPRHVRTRAAAARDSRDHQSGQRAGVAGTVKNVSACVNGGGPVFTNGAPNVTLFDPGYAAQQSIRSTLQWARPVLDNRLMATLTGKTQTAPEAINGLAYLTTSGEVKQPLPRPALRELDSLPLPAWDLVDREKYRAIWLARPTSSPAVCSVPSGPTSATRPGSASANRQNPKSAMAGHCTKTFALLVLAAGGGLGAVLSQLGA